MCKTTGLQLRGWTARNWWIPFILRWRSSPSSQSTCLGQGIEEIDINSWRDIEVQYFGGVTKKLTERFESPQHAINVIRRMLHTSGMVLDNASPAVLGHLSKNIRIAAMKTPLVDEDVGIAASIRIVNPQSMKQEDFINGERPPSR